MAIPPITGATDACVREVTTAHCPTLQVTANLQTADKSDMSLAALLPLLHPARFDAVAIGSSTGGPSLVRETLAALPADLPVPILIAQHLPPTFTPSFAAQCDREAAIGVVHAEDGMPVLPGVAYVGVGHQHLRVRRDAMGAGHRAVRLEVSPRPEDRLYKPSVDELMTSCARVYGRKTLGVMLTGIGNDGVHGAKDIIDAGGMLFAQSPETCVVYGMPRSCDQAGLTTASLSPDQIAQALRRLCPSTRDQRIAG